MPTDTTCVLLARSGTGSLGFSVILGGAIGFLLSICIGGGSGIAFGAVGSIGGGLIGDVAGTEGIGVGVVVGIGLGIGAGTLILLGRGRGALEGCRIAGAGLTFCPPNMRRTGPCPPNMRLTGPWPRSIRRTGPILRGLLPNSASFTISDSAVRFEIMVDKNLSPKVLSEVVCMC